MGQKPDDWRCVSLCRLCHQRQHSWGEDTFWADRKQLDGIDVEALIDAFCKASPKAAEIRRIREERRAA